MLSKFKNSKLFKIIYNKYTLTAIVFIFFMLIGTNNTFFQFKNVMGTLKEKQIILNSYKQKSDSLSKRLDELTNNKEAIEKYAREKYHFYDPKHEEIFIIKEN